jgi:GxxExxY protein
MKLLSENDISFLVRGACYKINKSLGPGLLESVYEAALAHELRKEGCQVETQVPMPVIDGEFTLDIGFRIDILVNESVLIEIKSVDKLTDIHYKQLLTYLKLSELKLGLLINFNSVNISNDIVRIVNKL